MRCMVKLNDLEELAESLLGGTLGASTLAAPKNVVMDLEEEEESMEEVNEMDHFSPGEANYGLV